MLTHTIEHDRGHVLLDALVSLAFVTISLAAAFSTFQRTLSLLSAQGPTTVLLCRKIECEAPSTQEGSRVIRCICPSHTSTHAWEVIR